jgi:hypothetical protein
VKILSLSFVGILLAVTAVTDSTHVSSITNGLSSRIAEATTTSITDISFGAKALEFLTYCNNQFSQTPISTMTSDILVFCTMVYDWYLMGCNNNNAIVAPIIAAQCNDPVILQQVIYYKTQIDIRIKQIVKIEVSPRGDGGGNGKLHDLIISITIAKDPIIHGNVQTITVTVSDAESNEKIQAAKVNGNVQYVTDHTETFSCITDASGKCLHSWRISGNAKTGTFTVSVQASASGYNPASKTTTFEVVAKNDNITLPIANDTIVNDTSRVIVNETGFNGNETGPSEGEQGDAGSNNGNVTLLPPPDPCIENPSLPECTLHEPPPLCEKDPDAEGCEPPPPPPPPIDPCEEDPTAEGCEDPEPIPELGDSDVGGDDGDDGGDGGDDAGGDDAGGDDAGGDDAGGDDGDDGDDGGGGGDGDGGGGGGDGDGGGDEG